VRLSYRTLALGVVAALCGCVGTVVETPHAALVERRAPIRKIAVAPIAVRPEEAAAAAAVVTKHLAEGIAARGFEVVAPEDVARAADPGASVEALAEAVQRQFGADAVLTAEITRWVEREGEAIGSPRPAAVGLKVSLRGAPAGERLWDGEFDRTQQAFLENVLLTPRYPGGGTRWLTAEEFAQFGASELVAALPAP
jgi:hypothetical protein